MAATTTTLTPRSERLIDFYGDPISIAIVNESEVFVALRPITEFLGLSWSSQLGRLKNDEVLQEKLCAVYMAGADGKKRSMSCLPLELLPGWLFGISPSKVKKELQSTLAPKLKRYREECFKVLWRAFQADILPSLPATQPASSSSETLSLLQVREFGMALVRLAEQQMETHSQVIELKGQANEARELATRANDRLDRAAQVVGEIQQRLTRVEKRTDPGEYISETQAAEISTKVNVLINTYAAYALYLAQSILEKNPAGKNPFQGIFGEIYRRFGVSSYKNIQQSQVKDVLAFLDEWRTSALKEE